MSSALFVRHALRRPATLGAILPSSRHLAHAMTRHAGDAHLLVELGAGTGAVTRALRERHPDVPLVAVEAQPFLAEHLRRRFPDVDVRTELADEVLDGMGDAPEQTIVVSSLPFRSLPGVVRDRTARSICRFLASDRRRRLVQFTYQPRPPFDLPDAARPLHWRFVSLVWRNAPPAGVWVLR